MHIYFKTIFILFLFSILKSENIFAQKVPIKIDSTHIYKNIESYSKRRKVTTFMYKLVFKPIAVSSPKNKIKKNIYIKRIQKPYKAFEGKTIRHINIETLDPFGYSVADTIISTQNFLSKFGNKLHVKSQHKTIRNLLLIRENQKFDSLLVKESERLVRIQGYVHDVSFFVVATAKKSDSVDIYIRELDNWSITPQVLFSNSQLAIQLDDKNFLGFGHEFKDNYTWYHTTGKNANNFNYFIPNIRNSYVNTALHYGIDEFGNFTKSFSVDRPFFSPFAKWAAGVNFTQQFMEDSIKTNDSLYVSQKYKFNAQDYWVGKSIQIFKGNTEDKRTTNLILAIRFSRIQWLEKPIEILDPLHIYSDENFYLTGIGISTRKYIQDKYIFRYGVTEDVPIGKVYGLTGGYQIKNNIGRLYLGARISLGNYYSWGYVSSNFEYGTFFHASNTEQGVFTAGINYFTKLFEIGKWKFRQFVKPQVTFGINRFPNDSLNLNNCYGLDGFNSSGLSGTNRILFTFQTQSYAPWNLIGFHFGPYFICSFGMLGNESTGFRNSRVYSQIGIGVLIKNENLIFGIFQFSISYYPSIPGNGQDILKINSLKSTDFGFRDFEIGKPATIVFQ